MIFLLPSFLQDTPERFEAKGRIVCLAEEMKERYKADVAPLHEHVVGFKTEEKRYYTLLRTRASEGLFADTRFKGRDLQLTGRVFPNSSVIEVTRILGFKDGKLFDVFYWCEVCAIRGSEPGACACCQGKVELREAPLNR